MVEVKQYIIVRKDVETVTGESVSPAKLAVMVAHASMAFLATKIKDCSFRKVYAVNSEDWQITFSLNDDSMNWIKGIFTKILLEADNLHSLERVVKDAEEAGLVEGQDFFRIEDKCLTELVPDEGKDTCFIAIGFKPMSVDKMKPIVKRLQVYK